MFLSKDSTLFLGLCRHNDESIKSLSDTNAVQVLLKIMQEPDEKLRTKTAFFITHLSDHENFRGKYYFTLHLTFTNICSSIV